MIFKDFVTLQRGFDLPKSQMRPGPYPVVGSTSVIGHHDQYKVEPPGVVMGRSGSLGTIQFIAERYWPHNTSLWVKDFKGNDPRFVFYRLLAMDFARFNAGVGVPTLNRNHLDSLELDVPPVEAQRRIVRVLAAYDELIENNLRRIRILEDISRSVYHEWFVEFRLPGHEKLRRTASPLGAIPRDWEGRFGDLATIARDSISPFEFPGEQFEHFSIPAFDDGRQPAMEFGETILSGKYRIDGSCVLLSKLNPRIPRVWLPTPSSERRAITSTEFLVLQPKTGVAREFIYAKCCSDEFADHFGSLAIGTSTSHQRVKPENLLLMPSTVPDREIIASFSRLVSPMLAESQQLRSKIRNLCLTRELLLPRLMSGQIRLDEAAA